VKLTEKQQRFADYYIQTANATESYHRAYGGKRSTADANGTKLLGNTRVKQYIEERNKQLENDRIVSMEEVKRFWSDTIRDEDINFKHRLKASEYIAKTNGAFIDRQEISGEMTQNLNNEVDLSKLSVKELKELESILSKTAESEQN
jgi:phage terminase small subunit